MANVGKGGGKRKSWLERAVPGAGDRKTAEIKINPPPLNVADCEFRCNRPEILAFLAKYRTNRILLHEWGKKGRTLHV